jgi:hypothetical protein
LDQVELSKTEKEEEGESWDWPRSSNQTRIALEMI